VEHIDIIEELERLHGHQTNDEGRPRAV